MECSGFCVYKEVSLRQCNALQDSPVGGDWYSLLSQEVESGLREWSLFTAGRASGISKIARTQNVPPSMMINIIRGGREGVREL